jgi:hypothetical protein
MAGIALDVAAQVMVTQFVVTVPVLGVKPMTIAQLNVTPLLLLVMIVHALILI